MLFTPPITPHNFLLFFLVPFFFSSSGKSLTVAFKSRLLQVQTFAEMSPSSLIPVSAARLARPSCRLFFFFFLFYILFSFYLSCFPGRKKTTTRSTPLKRCPWLVWIIVANKTRNQALLFTPFSHTLASSLVFVIPQKLFIKPAKTPPKKPIKDTLPIWFVSRLQSGHPATNRR